jgi:tetratricopeptide (TPR) repeat protein
MTKIISAPLFLVFLLLTNYPGFASEARVPELCTSSYQTNLLQGISKSFNLEEDAADASLKKAVDLEPDNPIGYAMEAMLHLFAYDMCFSLEQRQKEKEEIFHYSEEAIVRGEKRLARFPKDTQASLAVALAKIAKVYWSIKEKRYFVMAQETSNIWHYLEAAKSADPGNHDIDFLMGLLHYHIDHYAGMTGFLSSLLITEGNRRKGLQELQIAAEQGYLLRDIAQVELAAVYLNYEKQPSQALPIILQLKRKFPNNYSFSFIHCVALLELHRFAEAEAIAAQIETNIRSGTPPYAPQLQPRYYQLLGRIHFNRGEYGRAESYFHKAIQDKSFYNMRTKARSLLYLGMIHDIRQERKYAEDYYRRVLKAEGAEGAAQIEARQYLKTPYRVNEDSR